MPFHFIDQISHQVIGLDGDGTNFTAMYDLPWYSGMLDIQDYMPDKAQFELHYLFFPSENEKENDPVILWLNGGPGCSSLLGALTEHGPFMFDGTDETDDDNHFNDWSWNKQASVIYLESPPGVGFSKGGDGLFNDTYTAQINLAGILAFFDKFQDYTKQDFYVAGESYGGVYVPTLTWAIHNYNVKTATPTTKINLKGMAVGNGCTDEKECGMVTEDYEPLSIKYLFDQGVLNVDLWAEYNKACFPLSTSDECKAFLKKVDDLMDGVNIYDIDGKCYYRDSFTNKKVSKHYPWQTESLKPKSKRIKNLKTTPPCVDGVGPVDWLNDLKVKTALHVDTSITFDMCNDTINEKYVREGGSYEIFIYIYPQKKSYKILVYSGDSDGAVPITGTLYWIMKLRKDRNLKDIVPWTTWYMGTDENDEPQNGGSYWKMDGLSFVRFKGCGHMVPSCDPEGSFKMIETLLQDTVMPIDI